MFELTLPHLEPVYQRLRALRRGELVVDTRRAHLYYPDLLHPRWAVPAGDLYSDAAGSRVGDLVVLEPDAADLWLEEDRPGYGSPRSPFHRVDPLASSRHVRLRVAGQTIADTTRPVLLIETGVVPRWYLPPGDVAWDRLDPDPTRTVCQYKGEASYYRVRGTDVRLWSYPHPDPEAALLAGLLATAGEHPDVEITVDGNPEECP